MRWLTWTAVGLGIAVVLYVVSFVAVFDMGPKMAWYHGSSGGYTSGGPRPRAWAGEIGLDAVTTERTRIWQPLILLWCRWRGYDHHKLEEWVTKGRFQH